MQQKICKLLICCFCLLLSYANLSVAGDCRYLTGFDSLTPYEHVSFFDVQAEFDANGAMKVTETIHIFSCGVDIKRGIIRDLPTKWTRSDDKRFAVNYQIQDVQLDGRSEPYEVMHEQAKVGIRIGAADKLLKTGKHTYRITYTVANHFSRFPEWDELYWNVTGNDWIFPINKVRFSLSFAPSLLQNSSTRWESIDFYTGALGKQDKNARILSDGSIETTAGLWVGEGLTVAYTWPRSILKNVPDPKEDNPILRALLPSLSDPVTFIYWLVPILAAIYYVLMWRRIRPVGAKTTVIPIFSPPEGLSPGRLRYICEKKYDRTAFAADLLSIISNDGMRLEAPSASLYASSNVQRATKWSSKSTIGSFFSHKQQILYRADTFDLTFEDQHTVQKLFGKNNTLNINKSYQKSVREAFVYRKTETTKNRKELFIPIFLWWLLGLAFFVLLQVLVAIFFSFDTAFSSSLVLLVVLIVTINICKMFVNISDNKIGFFTLLPLIIIGVIVEVSPELLIQLFVDAFQVFFSNPFPDGYFGVLLCYACIAIIAYIKAPVRTAKGLEREAIAKGLKLYLGTAERRRFEALYPPEESVQHFEELLPYALALGVGKTWANRFDSYLAESGEEPRHLAGLHSWQDIHAFSSSSSRAAAIRPSKSSSGSGGGFSGSGSGGGGFSGGGSGGGGGRGW